MRDFKNLINTFVILVSLFIIYSNAYAQLPEDKGLQDGIKYAMEGSYDDAIVKFTQAIEANPLFIEAYFSRARVHMLKKDYDKAVSDYYSALQHRYIYAYCYSKLGAALPSDWPRNYVDQAIMDITGLIKISPDRASLYILRCLGYLDKSFATGDLSLHPKIKSDIDKAMEIEPDSAEAYFCRGLNFFQNGQPNSQILAFTRAIRRKPEFAEAYYYRGWAYLGSMYGGGGIEQEKFEQAISDFTKTIEINPQHIDAYHRRAEAYMSQRKTEKWADKWVLTKEGNDMVMMAIKDYTRAIEINPQDAPAYLERGWAYREIGEEAKAEADVQKAIEIDPNALHTYQDQGSDSTPFKTEAQFK